MSQGYTTKHCFGFGQLGLQSGNTELGPDGHVSCVSAPNLTDTSMFCRVPDEFCRNVVDKPIHTVQSHRLYKLANSVSSCKAPLQSHKSCLVLALAHNITQVATDMLRASVNLHETTPFNNNFTSCASFVWLWHKIYYKSRIIQKLSRVLNLSFHCAL